MNDGTIPEMTFANFVGSFAATGAMALQQIEQATQSPEEGESPLDVGQALMTVQHLIETLSMLETKTSGNLTDEETQALQAAVTDLKFGYVRLKDQSTKA